MICQYYYCELLSKAGAAGSKGVDYQLKLLQFYLLQGYCIGENFKLSTENEDAANFNDIVYEVEGNTILLQAKHSLQKKAIQFQQLFPQNSKESKEPKEKDKLLLVSISDDDLDYQIQYLIEQMDINDEYLTLKIIQNSIFDKIKKWFQSSKGVYLTKSNVTGYISQIRCSNYLTRKIKALFLLSDNSENTDNSYSKSFNNNLLLIKIRKKETYDLHEFKIYQLLLDKIKKENNADNSNQHELLDKMLFVDPNAPVKIVQNIINSFEVPEFICLIVPIFENFLKFSDINTELKNIVQKSRPYKKIIIVSDILDEENEFFQNFTTIESFVKFSNFSEKNQQTILQKKIKFQGYKMPLQNIIEMENQVVKWDDIIDEATLLKLAIGKEEILVNNFISNEEIPFYVKRFFIEINEDKYSEYFEHSNRWMNNCYIRNTSHKYCEQNFCTKIISQRDIFIAIFDSPGMGKSTIINRLACLLRKKPYWIIKINLNECTTIFYNLSKEKRKSVSLNELLILLKYPKLSEFEENLFNIPKHIILLVDALDEICPEYSDLILNSLISIASNRNIRKIVLTSRPHVLRKLKNKNIEFDMYALKHLSNEETINFLTNFWYNKLDEQYDEAKWYKINEFANKLHGILINNNGWNKIQTLIGIPLQIKMIGDIFTIQCNNFLKNKKNHIELPTKLNLNWLYIEFINRQKEIYIEEKCNAAGNAASIKLLENSFNNAINEFKREAIKLEFPPRAHLCFDILSSPRSCDENDLLKMGILIKSNKNVYFAHKTLSEYFASQHICELILNNKISKLLLEINSFKNNSFLYYMLQDHSIPEEFLLHTFRIESVLFNFDAHLIKLFIQKFGYEKLFRCLSLIDLKTVHRVLGRNLIDILKDLKNVNLKGINGITPLHLACQYGSKEMIDLLIIKGHSVKVSDGYGKSPLHFAVAREGSINENFHIIELLLKKGYRIEIRDNNGGTPLHYAVKLQNKDLINFLLNKGHLFNVTDYAGRTPLHYAAILNYNEISQFLINNGHPIDVIDIFGQTPLQYQNQLCENDTADFLSDKICKVDTPDKYKRKSLYCESQLNQDDTVNLPIYIGDVDGKKQLHIAAKFGKTKIIDLLLKKGHPIDISDMEGKTPLLYAFESKQTGTVKFLLNKGHPVDICNMYGETPLHYAIESKQKGTVQFLLNKGHSVDICNKYGVTPLHVASKLGKTEIIDLLLNKGHPINISDIKGKTPLHYAIESKQNGTVKFLLNKGHLVDTCDNYGVTPLHIASKIGKTQIIDSLLNKGHPIDISDKDGNTPLHYALESEQDGTVKFLLTKGHPIDICDNYGITPLHIASKFGKTKIIDLLLNKGHPIDKGRWMEKLL
ncbi:unnamed protein product [Psylliodes chrysocephalus]|uniref:NACHT domain-containing protein n=1 Tax=Psylliodes chrysocephalus TaxID=3402493 RepID=A0A9P0CZB3_9CUCU|nr:unnamed protein product [Psylliodes chrysocephala]